MRRTPSNIVKQRVFVQETVSVFEDSKWTIHVWGVIQGTVAGAFGAITFSPQLASPWWLLPAYLLAVFVIKRASLKLAQRLFEGDLWWLLTNSFTASFLLAALVAAVSRLSLWIVITLPLVLVVSFVIAMSHSTFRVVHVRDYATCVWISASLGSVATLTGSLLLYTEALTLSTASSAATAGALVGFLYLFLTTVLQALMWDVSASLSQSATAYVDKHSELEEGLKLHAAAIAANPKNPELYIARALAHIRRGDLDQAQADAERTLALDPKSRQARLVQAIIKSEQGDEDEAIAEFDQLLDCKLNRQVGYFYRGRSYFRKGDYYRALGNYEYSLRLSEDLALTAANRAETYYRMRHYDRAIADCETVLSLKTMTPVAYTMAYVVRGKSYAAKGEYKLAKSDLEAVFNSSADAKLLKEAAEELHMLPPTDDADDAE